MKIKKGDKVQIIAGKDKGKTGKVQKVDAKNNRVIVEGCNMVSKHQKPNAMNGQGGIISTEAPLDASNVMYLYNGKPTRLGYKVETVEEGGRKKNVKHRVAKSTGDTID